MTIKTDLTRNQFLKGAAASSLAVMLGSGAQDALAAGGDDAHAAITGFKGKNVVMFITDQEREQMHFPKGWSAKNLPGMNRLRKNGIQFHNSFTNSCMCSPARATLLTGLMPAQHCVRHTLEPNMPAEQYPQVELDTELKNIASVMAAAGYAVIYKGKFHLTKQAVIDGVTQPWVPEDLSKYGFARWNPKDAGGNQFLSEGGGDAYENLNADPSSSNYTGGNNDDRFMNEDGDMALGHEGAIAYINSAAAQQQPFFMIISLVNPHDVLFYPQNFENAMYADSDLQGTIEIPASATDSFKTKPQAQQAIFRLFNLSGRLNNKLQQRRYLNFYGNLMKKSDGYLVDTLDALKAKGLLDDTVIIRTSDHGEMGITHGGMRQKSFVFYEDVLRVPLIYSNPKLFPKPRQSDALVSHVDFLPTIATLFGAPKSARAKWQGVDYSSLIANPKAKPVQDYIVFTYDDFQCGQSTRPYTPEPNHMASIRETRWKLARYYDPRGEKATEWEMYDLHSDPDERDNLTAPSAKRTPQQEREFKRLKAKLATVELKRLAPMVGRKVPIDMTASTKQAKGSKTFKFTDKGTCTGVPTGNGTIVADWVLNPTKKTGVSHLTIDCGAGSIYGVAKVSYSIDQATSTITLTGKLNVLGGRGDFRGLKGSGLNFQMTDNLRGTNGKMTITGTTAYTNDGAYSGNLGAGGNGGNGGVGGNGGNGGAGGAA